MREVSERADVGRSTFYEHFEGKADLLEHSVARLVSVLAAATAARTSSDALRDVLAHVLAQRTLTTALLRGSTRAILIRVLARELERYLAEFGRRLGAQPIAQLAFLAVSLAHTQLAAVEAWLSSGDGYDVATAARVLHATTRAVLAAMLRVTSAT